MAPLGASEHLIKRDRQFLRHGAMRLQAQFPPAFFDTVSLMHRRHVETADESHLAVANQNLAMVANAEVEKAQGIEPAALSPALAERVPKRVRQSHRAKRIDQHPHPRPPPARSEQGLAERGGGRTSVKYIKFQPDRFPGLGDRGQHPGQRFLS